ncbi:MAG TPA: redoxin domain-containing protein [Bryobacteraceae bacterium]|nr:redoxin domain-containing protein [Bryobacteraceae bacterium]
MKFIPIFPLFGLLTFAQEAPDARTLLKETSEVLLHHKSYLVDQRAVIDVGGPLPTRVEMLVKIAVSSPGKLRIESTSKLGDSLIVSDGENTWMYLGTLQQYTKTAAASTPQSLVKSLVPGMSSVMDQLKAKDPYVSAKITGEETVEVEGQKIDCYVVEGRLDKISLPGSIEMSSGVQKVWVDKVSKLSLKQTMTATMEGGPLTAPAQMNQAVTITSQKLDGPVPDSAFAFTPPEGSKLVPEFKGPVKANADLTGQMAADFKLKSVTGKEIGLQDLKGNFVLIDFWATWCAPCRRDLPAVEKLHQEFHGEGLVVLGVNGGEDSETVRQFLRMSKLSYPVLLTPDNEVMQSYSVTAFPTVVLLDADGKIVFYHVGAGGDKALRESLAKLGLETELAH